jgi:hypothetical protein
VSRTRPARTSWCGRSGGAAAASRTSRRGTARPAGQRRAAPVRARQRDRRHARRTAGGRGDRSRAAHDGVTRLDGGDGGRGCALRPHDRVAARNRLPPHRAGDGGAGGVGPGRRGPARRVVRGSSLARAITAPRSAAPATEIPRPRRNSSNLSSRSIRSARSTVFVLTPRTAARSFAGGRRSPGFASPSAIARRISAATCS